MSRFAQLHLLTAYPPSNLNRDDLGRPKTALVGDTMRIRVSSQSLKRAWRTSEIFEVGLAGARGTRTKEFGIKVFERLREGGVSEAKAKSWARSIAGVFGKPKAKPRATKGDAPLTDKESMVELEIEQLAHFGPEEIAAIYALVDELVEEGTEPTETQLRLLRERPAAADIALFGRMLADSPRFNVEAAAQVAHAITVGTALIEDDFFTAVDDLNAGDEDRGAGHMGETEFGSGVFYLYLCIDRELLLENLNGDRDLANRALESLVNAATTVAPTGKQNSFASRARALYALAERGDQQPRSLAAAFFKPVFKDPVPRAVAHLEELRAKMDGVYGPCSDASASFNVFEGQGTLDDVLAIVRLDDEDA